MKRFFVDDLEVNENEFEERLSAEIEVILEDCYDEMLDECYEDFKIGCLSYCPSTVFKRVDEIAYKMGMEDYRYAMFDDRVWDLERYGDTLINGVEFRVEEDEDDEE